MANIFEEIMSSYRGVHHEEARNAIKENARKIKASNIKAESIHIFEEDEFDAEETFEIPDEDEVKDDTVITIIDPDATSEEDLDPNKSYEGDMIYTCPVCGGNYFCDNESEDTCVICDENGVPQECPICGDSSTQICKGCVEGAEEASEEEVVEEEPIVDEEDGEEATEEAPEEEEVEETSEEEVVEEEPKEEEEEEPKTEGLSREAEDDEDGEEDGEEDKDDDEEEVLTEMTKGDREALINSYNDMKDRGVISDNTYGYLMRTLDNTPIVDGKFSYTVSGKCNCEDGGECDCDFDFDDDSFNDLMDCVIRENYSGNSPKFEVKRVSSKGSTLKIRYEITEGKKVSRGTMLAEGFTKAGKCVLKIRDKGLFTESYSKVPAFIVECKTVKNTVIPVSMKYNYKVRVNESLYRVYGEAK